LARTYPAGVLFALAIRALPGETALAVLRRIDQPNPSLDMGNLF
jgi:hypothetical protein